MRLSKQTCFVDMFLFIFTARNMSVFIFNHTVFEGYINTTATSAVKP